MSLYELPNMTGGMDETLYEVFREVPQLGIGILFFVFGFVLITGLTSQRRREGNADLPYWAVLSSLSSFLVALVLSLKVGMISLLTLSIVVSITILTGIWFFLSRAKGEI